MTEAQKMALKNAAIGMAIVFAAYKFGKFPAVKAAALGVAGIVVANQVPFLKNAVKGV